MNRTYIGIAVLAVVVIILFLVFGRKDETSTSVTPTPVSSSSPSPTSGVQATGTGTKTAPLPNMAISIKNSAFSPSVLKIKTGTKVTWTNNDTVSHTVTFDSSTISSPVLAQGESYSYTFLDAGSITYHCNIHPAMKGSVVVE